MIPPRRRQHCCRGLVVGAALWLTLLAAPSVAQEEVLRLPLPLPEPPTFEAVPVPVEPVPTPAGVVEPLAPAAVGPVVEFTFCEFCGDSCGGGGCCGDCRGASRWGRFVRGVYRGICCPDPCYDPCWRPLADAAFFTAAVRPVNQQRFRWDHGEDMLHPDRAEYFWARANGAGPGPSAGAAPSGFGGLDYDELRHYSEVAHGSFGASFEYSYRSLDVDGQHFAGFGDMTIGAKSILFDTELVQVAFKMDTHVPQGSSLKGLGTGHVSLEPGLVFGLNLSQNSFLQGELTEWIPLGGTSGYEGAIFRYNLGYNRVIARPHPCVPIISVTELSGWRFQDGAFTAFDGTTRPTSHATFLNVSSGLRVFFCDKADFGLTYAVAGSSQSWTETLIRTELRFRY
ncbi:hypothetical protein Pla123a_30960 [Posidoniimonas polymericola]|uniref:Uncharacterized protein n=1 Tax=Posidoniimonas polymericola TaxID=2528002 RepID=A0A5C5YL38_9BACT|nr:hypothetical protein [Posidoniimonas polymericola]TWT75586.1 hypothetical protein Pla123a_30960 [Posidoniimonas polymericola]